jgi:hypothetical protein
MANVLIGGYELQKLWHIDHIEPIVGIGWMAVVKPTFKRQC